jgi:hypothetical protein
LTRFTLWPVRACQNETLFRFRVCSMLLLFVLYLLKLFGKKRLQQQVKLQAETTELPLGWFGFAFQKWMFPQAGAFLSGFSLCSVAALADRPAPCKKRQKTLRRRQATTAGQLRRFRWRFLFSCNPNVNSNRHCSHNHYRRHYPISICLPPRVTVYRGGGGLYRGRFVGRSCGLRRRGNSRRHSWRLSWRLGWD